MRIRQISAEERASISVPVQNYAFEESPAVNVDPLQIPKAQQYYKENITLVAEQNGNALAAASAIPMRQNVRGSVCRMVGIAGVGTYPLARRSGYAGSLIKQLLGQMRDSGHVVSVLYPFRPSFYQRLGYIGLPQARTVTFSPEDLTELLEVKLTGEMTWERIGVGYETYREFTLRLLKEWHGFALFPDSRAARLRDADDRWLVTSRVGDEVVGLATYRVLGHAEELVVDHLLVTSAHARTLLLQFFARHADHVTRVVTTISARETPELWATDLATVTQSTTCFPRSPAPMARVLSVEALTGMQVGPGQITVQVTDDAFISGRYVLDGSTGMLEVSNDSRREPEAVLTAAGLSSLIYGVLDPDEIPVRKLGDVPADAARRLQGLFPRRFPYIFASF